MMIRCRQVNLYDKEELPCNSDTCCLCCKDYKECNVKCTFLQDSEFVMKDGCIYRIDDEQKG